ncbi:MAG TPA: ABC transporter permease [Pyrinomonadaceae bacterium]|jgi:putative ABC transport system permease protein|nr:ABC transporter permease [Pyrinomonadaceae bacterium]
MVNGRFRSVFASLFSRVAVLWESFKNALASLRANKLRTILTLIGVIVGVSAVIAVVTIINGLEQTVSSTFSAQGSTAFTLTKRPLIIKSREELIKTNRRKDINEEDALAVQRQCSLCWRTGFALNGVENVKYGNQQSSDVPVRGVTLPMFDIEAVTIETGRLWTEEEGATGTNVAVIGPDVIKNLFDDAPPEKVVGRILRVGGLEFRVIGVTVPLGSVLGFSRDNFVEIPYQTAQKLYGSRDSLTVHFQVKDPAQFETAKDQVTTIMRVRRGRAATDDDLGFSVESQDVFVGLFNTATENIFFVTIGVAALSLVVGGIVVMNIMLVSVTERTKEIGLRKAVGARQSDIMTQFLIEAVTVTSVGGVIGVFTGFGLAFILAKAMGFPLLPSIWAVVMGIGVSSVVGIASGLYPAWKASRLNPVEAMRRE